jgi:hypothetical protein
MFKCCPCSGRSAPSTVTASDSQLNPASSNVKKTAYDIQLGRALLVSGVVFLLFAALCAGGVFGRGAPYLVASGLTITSIPLFCVAAAKLCMPAHWKVAADKVR